MTTQTNEMETENKTELCLNKEEQPQQEPQTQTETSLIPALNESKRFIQFLNTRFNLGLPNDFLISISRDMPSSYGYFAPKNSNRAFIDAQTEEKPLNTINLNSYYLTENNPYKTLAHETAHFTNNTRGIKDCSSNQYHNKHFKKTAEELLLIVTKTKKGYSETEPSDLFNTMLNNEFIPDTNAFKIFQRVEEGKTKKGSRLRKYTCSCGEIIRAGTDNLKAECLKCNTNFELEDGGDD